MNNPYQVGNPIRDPQKFFGRQDLFQFIEDNLYSNIKIILLHGQRRIGKSSILQQVAHNVVIEGFAFICCDLEEHRSSSLNEVLYNLAKEIAEKLEISFPSQEELNNPDIFSNEFLPTVYQTLGEKNLVLLLDEFDVVSSDDNILDHGDSFFKYLHSLIREQEKLFIIPVVGRSKDDLQNLYQLFNSAPFQEVGLLNGISAERLITKPVEAQGMLKYGEDAIQAILRLSSGHPYFTQAICFNLFVQARLVHKWQVTSEDIEGIVDKTIENVQAGLAWFWDGLSITEKVVFSAVAEAQQIANNQNRSFPEDPLTRLKNYGVIQTEELIQAAKQLVKKGYLDDTGRRVKIELIRRWLVQYYPLNREIFQLEEINKTEINKILKRKKQLYRGGKTPDLIAQYNKILELNPNHFKTISLLANKYLEIDNFDLALTLYTRAYQADPICNKEGFLIAQETYGKYLINQRELIKAKDQFEAVLEMEPDRKFVKDKIEEIKVEIDQQQRYRKAEIDKQKLEIRSLPIEKTSIFQVILFILSTIAIVIGIVGGSIWVYQLLTSCPQGQQKVNGSCTQNPTGSQIQNPPPLPAVNDNISSGDRTLFFSIRNTLRDQGIEAFKQGNYPQAVQLFKQAITANPSDPEVRIYYNNAIARQRGNPFTLAVVVPAENGQSRALEILRGVAQSQDQFNVNGGRDGRSLEIVIANDGDNEKQAEQIAQYLVNTSVLGVIGHGSSTTTKAALNIYKKAGIPIISPTSSATDILQGKNFFRTTPSDAEFGEKLAQYAFDLGLKKVVIVYNSANAYSNSLKGEFKEKFKEKLKNKFKDQGEIISLIDLTDPTLNIEQELKVSASQQVQAVILFPNVENRATALDIAKVNVNNKLGLKLLGGDALYNPKTLEEGGNTVEGLVLAVPWFREAPQARNFSQAAKQMWGGDISWRTATSYDAAQAFINSLSAQASRETILQKLTQIDLSARLTSGNNLKFQKGERQNEAILVKVESGKFTCLKQCSP